MTQATLIHVSSPCHICGYSTPYGTRICANCSDSPRIKHINQNPCPVCGGVWFVEDDGTICHAEDGEVLTAEETDHIPF